MAKSSNLATKPDAFKNVFSDLVENAKIVLPQLKKSMVEY